MITAKLSVNDMTRIPKQVRVDLNLNQGDRIVFEKSNDGEYCMRKLIEESYHTKAKKRAPMWDVSRPHADYEIGDLVTGEDGRVYRLRRLGWHFLDPTSTGGKNSWELA